MALEKETSCGGIIVYKKKALFLRSRTLDGKQLPPDQGFTIPKGHLDPGEDHMKCALREIKEETGMDVKRIGRKELSFTYKHPYWNTRKTVIIFLFESSTDRIRPTHQEEWEDHEVFWCGYESALDMAERLNYSDIVKEGIKELRKQKLL